MYFADMQTSNRVKSMLQRLHAEAASMATASEAATALFTAVVMG
jgi:hypothetical protein